ncbi:MAG: hypothetical protein ACLPOO_20635 [Terriglobales bacterium]
MNTPEVGMANAFSLREEIKYRFLYLLNAYPTIYMPVARLRFRHLNDLLVDWDADLVIEAFGRSGTTFANFAFLSAQDRPVKTVHHTHAAAQIITAVRMKIPTMVIVRPPLESALSHMARHRIPARPAVVAWIRYHRRILPYLDRIVVTTFDGMTRDFGAVIERINQTFGTNFGVWQHTKENQEQIFEQIRKRNRFRFGEAPTPERSRSLALPTPEREALKEKFRIQLQAPELAELRKRAQCLFTQVTSNSGASLERARVLA